MTKKQTKLLLDTNCLIDLADPGRFQRDSVLELVSCHYKLSCILSLNAISASENPKKGETRLLKFGDFEHRLEGLALGHLPILPPLFVWGVTFWNQGLWGGDEENALFKKVHDVLFSNSCVIWPDEALKHGIHQDEVGSKAYEKWVNRHCDVQMVWTAIHFGQDILVTSNTSDFQSKSIELSKLGLKKILKPIEAVEYLKCI
jgi:hypothetical protein